MRRGCISWRRLTLICSTPSRHRAETAHSLTQLSVRLADLYREVLVASPDHEKKVAAA